MANENKCNCGYVGKNGRALHAHKLTCKIASGGRRKATAAMECDCSDGGSWEVLTSSTEGAEEYYGKINPDTGKKYKNYCTECREVV